MTFEAQIVEMTAHPTGRRYLTSFRLKYPRFIHSELMTHRVFSRSASSSRAIPVKRMIEMMLDDPAFFVHIGKNQPGMKADEEVSDDIKALFKKEWLELAEINAHYAKRWSEDYGIHKQVVNRPLEAWQHMHTIVTATEWDNHWELRDHPDAQPEYEHLAKKMHATMMKAIAESEPTVRRWNPRSAEGWHLPWISDIEREEFFAEPLLLAQASGARSARVSYANHDGSNPVIEKDLGLFADLMAARPLHASPSEHPAAVSLHADNWRKNFRGFIQLRELVETSAYERVSMDYALGRLAA